jgi:hypothetical protein
MRSAKRSFAIAVLLRERGKWVSGMDDAQPRAVRHGPNNTYDCDPVDIRSMICPSR